MKSEQGFTLLEVMVAVAILGLGLTVILGSQVGLFSGSMRARNLTFATNLARCRLSELEEKLLREGYPLTDQKNDGECCGEQTISDYQCSWKIETIRLPQVGSFVDAGGAPDTDSLGALSKLAELQKPGNVQSLAAESSARTDVSQFASNLGSAPTSGIGPLLMGFVYPQLKPMLEASIRKLTVTVRWKEGKNDKDFSVTEYVTDPRQGQLDMALDGGAGGFGLPPTLGTSNIRNPLGGF